ncbi:hypothetical protein ACG5V6_29280, partial [Streptomyces chitinivorans]
RDTALAMGRWSAHGLDPSRITVPVDLWYGEEDTGHSPDRGAGRLPAEERGRRSQGHRAAGPPGRQR